MRFSLLSNVSFVVPILFCMWSGIWGGSFILVAVMLASSVYHLDENNHLHFMFDLLCVVTLTTYLLFILLQTDMKFTVVNVLALILSFMALHLWTAAPEPFGSHYHENTEEWEEYDSIHAFWHLVVSLTTLCILYGYFMSNIQKTETYLVCDIRTYGKRIIN